MAETQGCDNISTRLQRIAEQARAAPERAFTALNHHLDLALLREAFRRTRKDGATGIDGQTAEEYAENLEANLRSLLEKAKSGRYKAPPVRRAYIPKDDGRKRPLGIPTFEDKVLQRAVTMILEAIYEQDFENCSYGFRPGRSAHQALEELWHGLMKMGGGDVIDADVQGYFDNLDHRLLNEVLDLRVRDGVLRRLVGKWLNAGVMEDGQIKRSDTGTPQGGVISPLLANIYLHHVLDSWFEQVAKPRLRGRAQLIRYADDFVIACERRDDARRVYEVLPKRFGKYGLELHPEKTRLVAFRRPPRSQSGKPRSEGGSTFDLLGFTHYWGKSRRGSWVVKRKTARKRLKRVIQRAWQYCRANRHRPVREQHRKLKSMLEGHYEYFGITGNMRSLEKYYRSVRGSWKKWLGRRSQRAAKTWTNYAKFLKQRPLPAPRIAHSYLRNVAKP